MSQRLQTDKILKTIPFVRDKSNDKKNDKKEEL